MADVPRSRASQLGLVVVIEGPPRSGKTTMLRKLRDHLIAQERWCATCAIGDEVKDMAHAMLGIPGPADRYERWKDEAHPDFGGRIPRSVYCAVSQFARTEFGDDYFGKRATRTAADRVCRLNATMLLLDAGVEIEVEYLLNQLHPDKVALLETQRAGSEHSDYRRPIGLGLPRVVVSDAVGANAAAVLAEILCRAVSL